ncbi:MAG: four helix bundle protein [Terriglobia bacterium]
MQGDSKKRVTNFDNLHLFQHPRALVRRIYPLTQNRAFSRDPALAQPLRRATVSVLSNIAEGLERGSNAESHNPCSSPKALAVRCGRRQLCPHSDQDFA